MTDDLARDPIRVLYITSSSYSGSTLLAFLLNTHPDVCTVGEMDGWNYAPDREFHCSCGETIRSCRFFGAVAGAFRDSGLRFNPRRFGTDYKVVRNPRIVRWLIADLPHLPSSTLERLRDAIVDRTPVLAGRLARHDRANLTFIRTALAYKRASVFVDACKSPYRLRHLRRNRELDVRVLHLVRDPRGIALSNLSKRNWDVALSTKLWVKEQATITRIASEFDARLLLYYEELCTRADETVNLIYQFVGLRPHRLPDDFRATEHHILGNVMRLQEGGRITPDRRWEAELSAGQHARIRETALAACRGREGARAREIVEHYFGPS